MSGGDYHVEVLGSVGGNLVVGDHNLIVNAATGSSVTVLQEADRPKPVRRPGVRLLPRRPSGFIGRTAELGVITAAATAQSTIQVYGASGVGKSTLLRQAAFQLAEQAPDVAYLSVAGLGGADVAQEIFEACYQTSGYRPGSTELRRLMSGVRVCVLVDDLVVGDDALTAILDTAPDTGFVFSAVDRELWGQGEAVQLAGLPEGEALALFRREFGRDLNSAELAAASRAWRETGGSPIALLRAAAALAATPAAGAAPIPQQRDPDDPERTVAAPVPLTAPQRDIFDLLRALPHGPISASLMTSLVGAPAEERVEHAAARLAQVGLADETDEDTFRLAVDLVAAPAQYRRDLGALIESTVTWLSSDEVTPRDVAANASAIIGLVNRSVAAGQAQAGCRLARRAAASLALSLRWDLWRDLLISGQAAATACDDREALAYFTHERGIRMLCLGQAAAAVAVLASAVAMWQALGLTHSASLASAARAIAGASAEALPSPASIRTPRPPRPARRFIGRAVVRPGPGFPVAKVVIAVLAVLALIVAVLVYYGSHRSHPISQSIATPRAPASTESSPLPPVFAFSDFTSDGSSADLVLDNDPSTVWTSVLTPDPKTAMWIAIDLGRVTTCTAVGVTPAGNGVGFPAAFHLEYSADNVTWQPVPGQAYSGGHPFAADAGPQRLIFDSPVQARYVRLYADLLWTTPLGGVDGGRAARAYGFRLAEMHVLVS